MTRLPHPHPERAPAARPRHPLGWLALCACAALTACAEGLPVQTVPYEATSYDAGGGSYAFERADGYRGVWSKLPIVMRALRLHGYGVVVIA